MTRAIQYTKRPARRLVGDVRAAGLARPFAPRLGPPDRAARRDRRRRRRQRPRHCRGGSTLERRARPDGARRVSIWKVWHGERRHPARREARSEEHTSELQSRGHLVCRLLLEKKKTLATAYSCPT